MNTVHLLLTDSPWLAVFIVLLVIASIGVLIWTLLPEHPSDQRDADIERQMAADNERLNRAVQLLVACGVLGESGADRRLLPARDPASYRLADLWLWCRGSVPAMAASVPFSTSTSEASSTLMMLKPTKKAWTWTTLAMS